MTLHEIGIRVLRAFAVGLYGFFGGTKVYGTENIPPSGAVLLCPNHSSLSDPVGVFVASHRLFHYMAAAELFDIPGLGWLITFLQAFPVRRGENDIAAITHCNKLLKQGEGVVVFPEGKMSEDGLLGEFYGGAVLLALRNRCPIVPVAMFGFNKMLPYNGKFLHFARKRVCFGKPLLFDFKGSGLSVKEQISVASAQLRQALIDMGVPVKESQAIHSERGGTH